MVSRVRCGTWLYRFLFFAFLITFRICLPIDHLSNLILKAPAKYHFKMMSSFVVCCIYLLSLLATASVEANSIKQTRQLILEQLDLGPYCLTMRILKHLSRRQKQTTFVVIGALRIKTYKPESGFILFENLIVFVKVFFFKKIS